MTVVIILGAVAIVCLCNPQIFTNHLAHTIQDIIDEYSNVEKD